MCVCVSACACACMCPCVSVHVCLWLCGCRWVLVSACVCVSVCDSALQKQTYLVGSHAPLQTRVSTSTQPTKPNKEYFRDGQTKIGTLCVCRLGRSDWLEQLHIPSAHWLRNDKTSSADWL